MIRFLVGLFAATLTAVSFAGLVEVNTSQYIRESGSPYAQSLEVTLENDGEIRISNINLQDADVELAASTQIYLNGSSVLSPFQVPYGGYAVFPLSAGTHHLEVTLRGKPGGGLEVAFYENKPDAPIQGKGWELMEDGTVLHRKTGLVWHVNPLNPGLRRSESQNRFGGFRPLKLYPRAYCEARGCSGGPSIESYIEQLNQGDFGEDSVNGNAGKSDWRVPTPEELANVFDRRATFPAMTDRDGVIGPEGGWQAGMKYGEPFLICPTDPYQPESLECLNSNPDQVMGWFSPAVITTTKTAFPGYETSVNYYWRADLMSGAMDDSTNGGVVWPVRGGTSE
jgi:hypothetical protein